MLVAASLAIVSTALAATTAWEAFGDVATGDASTTQMKTEFLGIASLILQSVVFYLVGIGLYTLFVGPVSSHGALVPRSLLEQFTNKGVARETLELAMALTLVIPALVLFQWYLGRDKGQAPTKGQTAEFEES